MTLQEYPAGEHPFRGTSLDPDIIRQVMDLMSRMPSTNIRAGRRGAPGGFLPGQRQGLLNNVARPNGRVQAPSGNGIAAGGDNWSVSLDLDKMSEAYNKYFAKPDYGSLGWLDDPKYDVPKNDPYWSWQNEQALQNYLGAPSQSNMLPQNASQSDINQYVEQLLNSGT